MIVASVPVEILLGDAVTGTATKGPIESFVSSGARAGRASVTGLAMLGLPGRARRR
jgi:hypothetical protein